MDPNEALADMRFWITQARRPEVSDLARGVWLGLAVQASEALDEWLSNGGFLPSDWTR